MADKSRNLSQAKKKITVVKDNQIHKMTIVFTQHGQILSFWEKIVVFFKISSALATVTLFSAWYISRDLLANSQLGTWIDVDQPNQTLL